MIEHVLGSVDERSIDQTGPSLAAAIDGLLELDPDTLGDGELTQTVIALHRQQARLAAAVTRMTAAADARRVWADDGSRSCGAWLGHRCRLAAGHARAEVWLGRRLRTMPATAGAIAAGDVSVRHAMVLASLAGGRTAEFFARDEALLVDHARTMAWADFARAVEYWRQHADPDGVERDTQHDQTLRRVHLSPGLRGTGILDGMLTPLGYATVDAALRRIEQELFDADWAAARAEHGDAATAGQLARTPAQRRHDALVELAERAVTAPADGKRPQPLISVFVGYETFKGRICQLAGGTVVTPGHGRVPARRGVDRTGRVRRALPGHRPGSGPPVHRRRTPRPRHPRPALHPPQLRPTPRPLPRRPHPTLDRRRHHHRRQRPAPLRIPQPLALEPLLPQPAPRA
jgi:hypothetical protein